MNDKKHGKGVELLESGTHKFEGTFLNNSMDEGALTFDGGKKFYRGKFKDNKFEGEGHYEDKEKGFSYKGPFKEDKFDGEGKLVMKDLSYYHGAFMKGQKHGEGTEKYSNGDAYTGQWQFDQKQDIHDVFQAKSKKKIKCYFENDVNMGEVKEEQQQSKLKIRKMQAPKLAY